MNQYILKAFVVAPEINLLNVALHFGIRRTLKWDDSVKLTENNLRGIINDTREKRVYIYPFGSVVFVNFQEHEKADMLKYLKRIEKGVNLGAHEFFDEYTIEVVSVPEKEPTFEYMQVREYADYLLEVVATILAKSIALDRTEHAIDILLDKTESVVANLRNGHLNTSDSELAKMAANVLEFKLDTVSFVAILDKPEVTWDNEAAGELFDRLSKTFELDERYQKSYSKLETLKDITEVFTALSHAKRGNRLEWMIIILIAVELLVSLFDKVFVHFFR
jgi:uncharacterized Rmd1/YagE family protein